MDQIFVYLIIVHTSLIRRGENKMLNDEQKNLLTDLVDQIDEQLVIISSSLESEENVSNEKWNQYDKRITKLMSITWELKNELNFL